MNDRAYPFQSAPESGCSRSASAGVAAAAVLGLIAAWVSAGSVGLLAHGLRHVLTWLLLLVAVVSGWPPDGIRGRLAVLFGMLAAGIGLTAVPLVEVNVMAIPVVLAGLVSFHTGAQRRVLLCASFAVSLFALYRLLLVSSPFVWVLADRAGRAMGFAAGWAAGRPLLVGATFGGMDFLVVSVSFYGCWLAHGAGLSVARVAGGAAGILAAQSAYLVITAFAADLRALLPAVKPGDDVPFWLSAARGALPWNVPALGAVLHACAVAAMARWAPWRQQDPEDDAVSPRRGAVLALAIVAAAVLALGSTLSVGRYRLEGRTVVFYEKGFLNWLQPKHEDYGRLSIGMYGMLPHFVRSLGAQCIVSPELSAEDLRNADVLVLIYPDKPWKEGQVRRIHEFVERGGSLLLLGEHTVGEEEGGACFNAVLQPTRIRVQFDCAEFAVGGWLQSFTTLSHPTTLGIPDDRNELGIVIGGSLDARWPAFPVAIGRWGWSDWGDRGGNAFMGNRAYDAGEKLGDIVLVAEQRLGKGRVLVFGDTSSFCNGINMGSHMFTSRIFAYLAGPHDSPVSPWRVRVLLPAAVLLAWFAARRGRPLDLALVFLVLAALRAAGTYGASRAMEFLPDGTRDAQTRLAYVDASHAGMYSSESWRDDGLMGLAMNLMRNGYLTMNMHEFTAEALRKADVFVSVAPAREYAASERRAIRQFLEQGGIFILTVGYDERGPSLSLLREFGFDIGDGTRPDGPSPGPRPLGFFKSPYYNAGAYTNHVRFHAAWPVFSGQPDAKILAYGRGDQPVILMRPIGRGKMVVVGDTCFAMNKNLEVESGAAFEGMRENPYFWRWLLTYLRGERMWIPPNPRPPAAGSAAAAPPDGNGGEK